MCSNQRTRKLLTPELRRRHLSSHPLIIERNRASSDKVEAIREYVDTGKGHLISTTCFRPKSDKKLKGMICYNAGYSSYTEWTDSDVALNFVERGFIFVCFDHYGHGRSDGDWLTIKPMHDYNVYTEDALYIFERAKRKYSPKQSENKNESFRYLLFGHSMGGAVAIQISKQFTSASLGEDDALYGWDGLILSAPMVAIKEEMKPKPFLIQLASFIVWLCPNARIVPTKPMVDKLTRCQKYFEFIQKSPLMYDDKPALKTAFNLLGFANKIESELEKVKLPLLVMHGEKDKITDPQMAQLLFDKCSSKQKKIKIFEGAFHALLLDECRDDVYKEVDEWIDSL